MNYVPPKPFAWNYCGVCGARLEPVSDGERHRPYCSGCNRHYYLNPVPACCVFVQDQERRLLFVKRAVEPCLGSWTLPGGFMELDESGEECALRELEEETGLTGDGVFLLGAVATRSQDKGGVLVLGYIIERWRGQLRPDSDASDLCFYGLDERPLTPFDAHRALMALFDAREP